MFLQRARRAPALSIFPTRCLRGISRRERFFLRSALPYFPAGSVFLAVVDPGVGTQRKAIALEARGFFFVGPDNGLLTAALPKRSADVEMAVELKNPKFRLKPVSTSFHGRDIFAPAAAALATGVPLTRLGPKVNRLQEIPPLEPTAVKGGLKGKILWVDRFGNGITNLPAQVLENFKEIRVRRKRVRKRIAVFAEGKSKEVCAMAGSFQLVELVENAGSAAKRFGFSAGDEVAVFFR